MKKSLRNIIGLIIICSVIIIFIVYKKNHIYERPNYPFTAVIYHSEFIGFDAGYEYSYQIYKLQNSNKYIYIKSKSINTIKGPDKSIDISSGKINNKKDLKKITRDIKKDSEEIAETYVTYNYYNNDISVECKDINELGKKLFD